MMEKDLISIVVACYNVDKYLKDFFNAINQNTYKKIELIFVNDGSTDKTGLLLDEYKLNKSNVKVIHQENAGVSASRNAGLKMVNGEYVTFFDPDDVFDPNMLMALHKMITDSKTDVSMCLCKHKKEFYVCHKSKINPSKIKYKVIIGKDKVMARHIAYTLWAPWNKLFKTEIVKKIKNYPTVFEVGSNRGEDSLFCSQYLTLCESSAMTWQKFYYHRVRKNSLSHVEFTEEYLTLFHNHHFLETLDKDIYKITQKYIKTAYCLDSMDCIGRIYLSKKFNSQILAKKVYDYYRKNVKYFYTCKYYSWIRRLGMPLSTIGLYFMVRKYL